MRLDDPARLIFCHCCQIRGNLLTLIHGLEFGRAPEGGRLRGNEFKAAAATLRSLNADEAASSGAPPAIVDTEKRPEDSSEVNVPLRRHAKPAARQLENLYEDLVIDPAAMPPEAGRYFRDRPWLADAAQTWGVGYLPKNGRSLLRGMFVYTHRNERGDVLSYSGRDVNFEEKWLRWQQAGSPDGKKPNKHRYVKGFHRGLELFGQQAARLKEPRVQESLREFGLLVVEGANDVIRLDTLGVAAVGLCSNRATSDQIEKIDRFARQAAQGRVTLLPDCDEPGEEAFQELLWKLNERGLRVRLGWSRRMHGGRFENSEPEQLTDEQWASLSLSLRGTASGEKKLEA